MLVIGLALVSGGCGRYGDFSLPVLASGEAAPVMLRWDAQPVMSYGTAGQWDSSDVLNPSVIRHDGQFWNFYSGFDGKTWFTGLATSPDGSTWTRRGRVLAPEDGAWDRGYIAANGSAIWRNGEFLYWYQAGAHGDAMRIGLARSSDGLHWRKEPHPVLDLGPYMSWDERAVADPYVIEAGGWLYLYYLGQDRAARQRIGVARSRDGVAWEKLRSNPVLEMTEPMEANGLGEPAVFVWKGHYRMLFTGRDASEIRRIGAAWSNDGVHWTRQKQAFAGDQAWDAKVVCDPTVVVEDSRVRVWFGGGDVASPNERLHGQIGTGVLQ